MSPRPRHQTMPFRISGPPLLGLGVLIAACEQEPQEKAVPIRPIPAIRVADTTRLSESIFSGHASAEQEVNLSFRVSGPLITLSVDVGDRSPGFEPRA